MLRVCHGVPRDRGGLRRHLNLFSFRLRLEAKVPLTATHVVLARGPPGGIWLSPPAVKAVGFLRLDPLTALPPRANSPFILAVIFFLLFVFFVKRSRLK